MPALSSGEHVLEVKARDADGNVDPGPAALAFTVLPVPLQQRVWFVPLVLALAAALLWLAWLQVAHTRQLAATNAALRQENDIRRRAEAELEKSRKELEMRVAERTAELTQANESLNREMAERKLAEERQRGLEQQLRQSQKMEAIGTLAGGIAHDFNNILAVIIPYCQLVAEELSSRPDLQKQVGVVLKAAERAEKLVQQILAFSRRQRQELDIVDLRPIVTDVLRLLRSALPSTLQMVQNIHPAPPVLADPTHIHQVIMNLCVNAQHAMEGRQGVLEVGLDGVWVDQALCARSPDLHVGLYARMTVRDTGCGMSEATLSRIFEPFFTTKEIGRGTGLGLAVVHGIVKQRDGAILVQSRVGEGTLFEVFLPAHTQPAAGTAEVPRPAPSRANGEQVIIVDDEPDITGVLNSLLRRAGYSVITFNDPRAALAEFVSRPADTDLIFTDLTMPGMTGLDLAKTVFDPPSCRSSCSPAMGGTSCLRSSSPNTPTYGK